MGRRSICLSCKQNPVSGNRLGLLTYISSCILIWAEAVTSCYWQSSVFLPHVANTHNFCWPQNSAGAEMKQLQPFPVMRCQDLGWPPFQALILVSSLFWIWPSSIKWTSVWPPNVHSQWTNSPEEPSGEENRSLQAAAQRKGCNVMLHWKLQRVFQPKLRSCPFRFTDPPLAPSGLQKLMYQRRCVCSRNCHWAVISWVTQYIPVPGRVLGTPLAAARPFLPLSCQHQLRWEVQEA